MNKRKISQALKGACVAGVTLLSNATTAFAVDGTEVSTKVNQGLTAIQGILTGIVAIVGVIAALKIIISKLPSIDDPHVKNEMWRSVGGVGVAVAVGGSLVWLIPWVYSLLQ